MKVMQILRLKGSADVVTVPLTATVAEAVRVLSQKRIGALIVANSDGSVAGILSERDVVRCIGAEGAEILQRSVRDLMTKRVECCSPEEDANSVLGRMSEGRFRHMPVMESGKMVGLLSIGDVVKARITEIEAENAAMANMLSG